MRKVPADYKLFKILSFAVIGHFLELYDYTIYAVLLSILSPIFFPSTNFSSSLSLGMISFAFSLVISPFAAYFWGNYGDKYGRLPMLRKSIFMMAFPSLVIALLPTYQEVGVVATIALTLCRFIQTFSASGEINGAKIFVMEHFGAKHLGKISGLFSCVGGLGVLVAMAMGWALESYDLSWRVPFFVGSSLAIVGVLIRRKIGESPEFLKLIAEQKSNNLETQKTFTMIWQNARQSIIVVIIAAVLGILSYMMHGFLNPYLVSLGIESKIAYKMGVIGLAACGLSSLLSGLMMDSFVKERVIFFYNLVLAILFVPLSFMLIIMHAQGYPIILLYLAFVILGALLGVNASTGSVIMFKLFPPKNRCRGVIISYSIGISVFGGLTPFVLNLVSSKINIFAPAILVMGLIVIALVLLEYKFFDRRK